MMLDSCGRDTARNIRRRDCASAAPRTAYSSYVAIIESILRFFVHRDPDAPARLPSPDELVLLTRPNGEKMLLCCGKCLRRTASTRW